jgi:hypothetical protein
MNQNSQIKSLFSSSEKIAEKFYFPFYFGNFKSNKLKFITKLKFYFPFYQVFRKIFTHDLHYFIYEYENYYYFVI